MAEQAWVREAGDVGLDSGSVTDLLQYDKSLHSKILCKMRGYRIIVCKN